MSLSISHVSVCAGEGCGGGGGRGDGRSGSGVINEMRLEGPALAPLSRDDGSCACLGHTSPAVIYL